MAVVSGAIFCGGSHMKIRVSILLIGTLIQIAVLFLIIRPLYQDAALSLPLLNAFGVLNSNSILILAYGYFYFGCATFFFMGAMRRYLDGYGVLLLTRGKAYPCFIVKQFAKIVFAVCVIYGLEVMMSILLNRLFHFGIEVRWTTEGFISAALWISTVSILIWMQMMLELWMPETVAVLIINLYGILSIMTGARFLTGITGWEYILFLNYAMYVRVQNGNVQWIWILLSLAGHAAGISLIALRRIQRRDYL